MVAPQSNPLFRLFKLVWWVIAIWLSVAVLIGVIRGAFITGPVPTGVEPVKAAPAPADTLP
jgi:hypothetical protein